MKTIIIILFAFSFCYPQDLFFFYDDEDTTPPAVPQNLLAIGGKHKINLTWDANTERDLWGYKLYRGISTNPTDSIAFVLGGTETYQDSGSVSPDSIYIYRVSTIDVSGNNSDYSDNASDTCLGLYAIDFDGSTEYLSKSSPINLNLNGSERITAFSDRYFETKDSINWATNGTHSIDTSTTFKYEGTRSGKIISTGIGDISANYISLAADKFTTLVEGEKYTYDFWALSQALNGDSIYVNIGSQTKGFNFTADSVWAKKVWNFQATASEVGQPIKFYCNQADTIYIDNVSLTQRYDLMVNYYIKITDKEVIRNILGNNNNRWGRIDNIEKNVPYISDNVNTNIISGSDISTSWKFYTYIIRTSNDSLYVNGILDGSTTSGIEVGKIPSMITFYIGTRNGVNDLYSDLLSETQVVKFTNISTLNYTPTQLYNLLNAGRHLPSSYTGGTIVGHWTWVGTSTTFDDDKSGTGNDLTGTNITIDDRIKIP